MCIASISDAISGVSTSSRIVNASMFCLSWSTLVAPMITVACGVSMTLLQFFWGALIVKQLKKLLAPPPDSDGSRYAQHQEEVKVLI